MRGAVVWLEGFGVTLAAEETIAMPLLRAVEPSLARRALAVLLVNLATHPVVWFVLTRMGWPPLVGSVAAEVWAFAFEIVGYRVVFPGAAWTRCALTSVAANTGSLLLGFVAVDLGLYR